VLEKDIQLMQIEMKNEILFVQQETYKIIENLPYFGYKVFSNQKNNKTHRMFMLWRIKILFYYFNKKNS